MLGTINKLPRGLLDLFRLKTGGRNPSVLGEQLQPQLDLVNWYLQSEALHVTGIHGASPLIATANAGVVYPVTSTAPTALPVDASGAVAVPENEIWVISLWETQWQLDNVATDQGEFLPGYQTPQGNTFIPASTLHGPTVGVAAADFFGCRTVDDQFTMLPGGSRIVCVSARSVTATSLQFGSRLRLQRLLV